MSVPVSQIILAPISLGIQEFLKQHFLSDQFEGVDTRNQNLVC